MKEKLLFRPFFSKFLFCNSPAVFPHTFLCLTFTIWKWKLKAYCEKYRLQQEGAAGCSGSVGWKKLASTVWCLVLLLCKKRKTKSCQSDASYDPDTWETTVAATSACLILHVHFLQRKFSGFERQNIFSFSFFFFVAILKSAAISIMISFVNIEGNSQPSWKIFETDATQFRNQEFVQDRDTQLVLLIELRYTQCARFNLATAPIAVVSMLAVFFRVFQLAYKTWTR